jgi:NTP pyrophosphatase (non-canonical NTP hydrolase)
LESKWLGVSRVWGGTNAIRHLPNSSNNFQISHLTGLQSPRSIFYMGKPQPLTFEKFRTQNKKRCEKYFHLIPDWSEAEWAVALAGECGELCNFIKKRVRIVKSKAAVIKQDSYEELGREARKEIGDILAYLDLLAQAMGVRLEDCVVSKFNEVSDRVNSKIKL